MENQEQRKNVSKMQKKYSSRKEWEKNSLKIYRYVRHKKWLQEIKSLVFNQ
jgi:hypothetical protein